MLLSLKHSIKSILLMLLLSITGYAQVVGGAGSPNMPSPTEVKASQPVGGNSSGDVNLFNGSYNENFHFGTLKTPGGVNFSLDMSYSSTFAGGDNPPLITGLPYGEGWSLGIPAISITAENYVKYINDTMRVGKSFSNDEGFQEGRVAWFAPMISIPGIINERFVFKYKDGVDAVFVPARFDKYVEARFNGQVWVIRVNDGTMYRFETATVNTRNAVNQRMIPYNNTAQGTDPQLPSNVLKNLVVPKSEVVTWYCDEISHPNATYSQKILFTYDQFGKFDFLREFNSQQDLHTMLNSYLLGSDTICVTWAEHCGVRANAFPSFYTYRDVYLKSVDAIDAAISIGKIELKYQTVVGPGKQISPDSTFSMLIPTMPGVTPVDSVYNSYTVYSRGHSNTFDSWKRFPHLYSEYYRQTHFDNTFSHVSINPLNPYKGRLSGNTYDSYFSLPVTPGLSEVPMSHSYLESERIWDPNIVSGDLYEIKTTFKQRAVPNRASIDINITSGQNVDQVYLDAQHIDWRANDYDISRGTSIFNTFGQALKWNLSGNSKVPGVYKDVAGDVVTSNFFVMSNLPNQFQGFHIQVGPGNSDSRFDDDENFIGNQTNTPYAQLSYFNEKQNAGSTGTHYPLLSTDRPPYNFGLGLPWHMVRPLYENLLGATPYQFWFNRHQQQAITWSNQPTAADSSTVLKGVELIRYSKNPYMLTQVNVYTYNGEQSDQSTGQVLTQQYQLIYRNQIVDSLLNNRFYLRGSPEYKLGAKQNVLLLKEVRQIPVNSSVGTAVAYDPSRVPTTHFSYTTLKTNKINTFVGSATRAVVLTGIVDQLGKSTQLQYNDTLISQSKINYVPYRRLELNKPDTLKLGDPIAVQIYARVNSKTVTGDAGSVQRWDYVFSGFTSYEAIPNVLGSNHYHQTRKDTRIGFTQVKVTEPALLGSSSRPYTVYYHSGDEMLFGRLLKSVSLKGDGTLISQKDIFYSTRNAYRNAVYRDVYLDDRIQFGDYRSGNIVFALAAPELRRTGFIVSGFDTLNLLEATDPLIFPATYLNSYFVKKTKEIDTRYDKLASQNTTPISVSQLGISIGLGQNTPVVSTLSYNLMQNITEYEYYEADSAGHNASGGFMTFLRTPSLDWEPSWELYSSKTYSPQLPDAYSKTESFYYYDLLNTFGRTSPDIQKFVEMYKMQQYSMRNIPFQQRLTTKTQSGKPLSRSTYYIQDAYWNPTDELQGTTTIIDGSPRVPNNDCPYLCGGSGTPTPSGSSSSTGTPDVPASGCRLISRPDLFKPRQGEVVNIYNGSTYYCPCRSGCDGGLINTSGTIGNGIATGGTPSDSGATPPDYINTKYILFSKIMLRSVISQIDTVVNPNYSNATGSSLILKFQKISRDIGEPGNAHFIDAFGPVFPFDTILVKAVQERNYYGQEKLINDNKGLVTKIEYSLPNRTWYRNANSCLYCNNFLTSSQNYIGLPVAITEGADQAEPLRTVLKYHMDNSIDSIIDPNQKALHYSYDIYGRLKETYLNSNLTSLNRYSYWTNDPGLTFEQRAAQNYVESYRFYSQRKGTRSRDFVDPLGRAYASAMEEVTDSTSSQNAPVIYYGPSNVYDYWNRVTNTYNGFKFSNPGLAAIQPHFGVPTDPHKSIGYEDDQRSRVLKSAPQGEPLNGAHYKQFAYSIIGRAAFVSDLALTAAQQTEIMPCPTCSYYFERTTSTDEDGKVSYVYTDGLGRKIAMKQNISAASSAITLFGYDSYGNINKVTNPLSQVATYKYNMLGWLQRKQTVDAGAVNYVYDNSGKVFLEEDANLRTASTTTTKVRLHTYDKFGRPTSQLTTTPGNIFPQSGDEVNSYYKLVSQAVYNGYYLLGTPSLLSYEKKWFYGSSITLSDNTYAPKALPYLQGERTNMKGKLSHTIAYNGDGTQPVKYCFYSYNAEGRPAWEIQQVNPNGINYHGKGIVSRIEYPNYDLQGNLLTENVDVNIDSVLDIQYYHAYDNFGKEKEVYANFTDSKWKGFKVASFDYSYEDGLMSRMKYYYSKPGVGTNAVIDSTLMTYDIRKRLTEIKSSLLDWKMFYNSSSPGNVNFDQCYNGNINGTQATYSTANVTNASQISVFTGPTIYGYKYDGINRLSNADGLVAQPIAGILSTGLMGDESLTYDKIGNILTYTRGYGGGTIQDDKYSYTYSTGTNRLSSVVDPGVMFVVNRRARNYTYDLNGSLTSDDARSLSNIVNQRGNLPFSMDYTSGAVVRNIQYLYNQNDDRIFKSEVNTSDAGVDVADYYLRNMRGQEIGTLSLHNATFTWYVYGTGKRVARITPTSSQQPAYNPAGISDYSTVDPQAPQSQGRIQAIKSSILPDNLLQIQKLDGTKEFIMQKTFATLQSTNISYLNAIILTTRQILASTDILRLPKIGGDGTIRNGVHIAVGTLKAEIQTLDPFFGGGPIIPPIVHPSRFKYLNDTITHNMVYLNYDHLGNTRASYTPTITLGNQGITTTYTVRNFIDYFAASGKVLRQFSDAEGERYMFNSKERDVETGEDYYGFRYYDSEIARFTAVDPLRDNYPSLTTYQFSSNNPVLNIDLDGLEGVPSKYMENGNYTTARSSTYYVPIIRLKVNEKVKPETPTNQDGAQLWGSGNGVGSTATPTKGKILFNFDMKEFLETMSIVLGYIPEGTRFEKPGAEDYQDPQDKAAKLMEMHDQKEENDKYNEEEKNAEAVKKYKLKYDAKGDSATLYYNNTEGVDSQRVRSTQAKVLERRNQAEKVNP